MCKQVIFTILWIGIVLALAGCNRDNVQVERAPEGGANITVTLSESDVNAAITQMLEGDNPLLRNPSVDLQNGQIIVTGEHDRRDGSGRVSGTITLIPVIDDGALEVQATAINIEGFDASDARITQFNERLANTLRGRLDPQNRNVTWVSVTVSDTQIEAVINVKRMS